MTPPGAETRYLVGAEQNRWGDGKAERLGGLEVHDHLEFCWKLHREIARLLAAQDAIDIGGTATIGVYQVSSVGKQAAFSGIVRYSVESKPPSLAKKDLRKKTG